MGGEVCLKPIRQVSDNITLDENAAISARNLNFIYNAKSPFFKQALKDVTLTVNRGEFVAIVGHTGSGKSTFVQHLNALIRVQSGELYVLNRNLGGKRLI